MVIGSSWRVCYAGSGMPTGCRTPSRSSTGRIQLVTPPDAPSVILVRWGRTPPGNRPTRWPRWPGGRPAI